MSDTSPSTNPHRRTTLLSAVILALPPLFALLAGLFPGAVPVPFVDASGGGIRPLLLVLAATMLLLNGAVLYALHRMAGD